MVELPSRFGPRDLNEVDMESTQVKDAVSSPTQSRAPLLVNAGAATTHTTHSDEGPVAPVSKIPTGGPIIGRLHTFTSPDSNNVPRLQAVFDWSEVTDDDKLGDVPEFPILKPSPTASESKPEISKDSSEKNFDEEMAELNWPGENESDESLHRLWDDNNQAGSIRIQNFALKGFRKSAKEDYAQKCEEVDNLLDRVKELEREHQVLEGVFPPPRQKLGQMSYRPGSDNDRSSTESSDEEMRHASKDKKRLKTLTHDKQLRKDKRKLRTPPKFITGAASEEESSDDFNAKLLQMEPESDHNSDSEDTKRLK
ncbi:hypothetical protein BDR06DRAFT_1011632 [Suillus hirtellus]|nr:hypothetical protein BDR06DRAFT_1011632 [Suillus hirtellus]